VQDWLRSLGIQEVNSGANCGQWIDQPSGGELTSVSPIDGKPIARILQAGEGDYERVMENATRAFHTWRMWPAPRRGEVVRQIGEELRKNKDALGRLVTLEMGKIQTEGLGEVQEMIDMADFAVGLSRQLYGLTMHSERPRHRMYEQWHPLGVVGIITAFNFPVAVWSWNAMIAAVCGDTMVWKPSSLTPLCAIAVQNIVDKVTKAHGIEGVFTLAIGSGSKIGERMINDPRVPLVSATGSTPMGVRIGETVAKRLGRTLLELGGNNAIIVTDDADLNLALRAILFGAVGTAGQRCTSTRRIFMQKGISDALTTKLVAAYKTIKIGDPLDPSVLMGPLVDAPAVETMMKALEAVRAQGGEVIHGGRKIDRSGYYVEPALVRARPGMEIVREETFAPILYLVPFEKLSDAIAMHNEVPQGLSSAIFTRDLQSAETFLSHEGSDCGIANVNIGTSGAEIGGAFGGEKETGGGREAGSDAWKTYMRRQTCTINWSNELPLAQGVQFGD
jgi:aldehyde dehydrogenase (NAD+)